jgi:hypothetical protein
MQNNKDAGQQDDDKLQLAMTAVEDAGERLRLVLDVSRHQLERYNITGAEARAGEGSGRQRSGEGRSPSICWYWERTEHASVGPAASGSHSYCQQLSPKDAGPAAKKPRGKMVKNTEILGEFRRTLSRFSAAN